MDELSFRLKNHRPPSLCGLAGGRIAPMCLGGEHPNWRCNILCKRLRPWGREYAIRHKDCPYPGIRCKCGHHYSGHRFKKCPECGL